MSSLECLTLPDGRSLEVWAGGDPSGRTLVFHNGTPSSGRPLRVVERAAEHSGLRLVSITRPGYSGSTRLPGRAVTDVVQDAAHVLEALGVRTCVVAGWSGGGPHALACAARLPQARAVACIAGVGPSGTEDLDFTAGMGEDNVQEFGAALDGETALRVWLDEVNAVMRDLQPADLVRSMDSLLSESDKAVMDEECAGDLAAGFREAVRNGVDGWLDDDLAFAKPWGFDLGEISIPSFIWQGSADLMVPFDHGRWLVSHVPGAVGHLDDGAGHFSVALGRLEAIFAELVSATTD